MSGLSGSVTTAGFNPRTFVAGQRGCGRRTRRPPQYGHWAKGYTSEGEPTANERGDFTWGLDPILWDFGRTYCVRIFPICSCFRKCPILAAFLMVGAPRFELGTPSPPDCDV